MTILGRLTGPFILHLLMHAAIAAAAEPTSDQQGFAVHPVSSKHQSAETQVRVLTPVPFDRTKKYPVIYLLPVEAARQSRYGDGLLEVKRQKLHEKHAAIFVAPTFAALPWYADHPTDGKLAQERYFLEDVLPLVEANYPTLPGADGRLLCGFSKSGWGAWSLLLRHPDKFAKASAWDAPLAMEQVGKYGNGPIFGTQDNFEKYRIVDLLRQRRQGLGDTPRLIQHGYGGFREHHQTLDDLLSEMNIPSVYHDGPKRKHDWHSGWVEEAVEALLRPADGSPKR